MLHPTYSGATRCPFDLSINWTRIVYWNVIGICKTNISKILLQFLSSAIIFLDINIMSLLYSITVKRLIIHRIISSLWILTNILKYFRRKLTLRSVKNWYINMREIILGYIRATVKKGFKLRSYNCTSSNNLTKVLKTARLFSTLENIDCFCMLPS